jgi:hypothetical protein
MKIVPHPKRLQSVKKEASPIEFEIGMVVSPILTEIKQLNMKTKTKRTDKAGKKSSSTGRTSGRGLNTDEQKRTTNASKDDDEIVNSSSENDVEEEEDREKKRKMNDEQGE